VFNLLMLFFLMRLWPLGGRLGLGESETLVMSVPFSEFVRRVRHDDVSTVSVDGLHVSFSLKPGSITLPGGCRHWPGKKGGGSHCCVAVCATCGER
jgi:hypothetical protein